MNRKFLFIAGSGLILMAFVVATVLYKSQGSESKGTPGGREVAVLERQGAPVKGPDDARVTIVEFFDPACGTCADFYPLVKQLMDQYPGKVRVMMRYAPLHRGSDQVVKMLEAAHLQGKFWPALEQLFANQRRWIVNHVSQPTHARSILNAVAMDHARLNADMNSQQVMLAVGKDVEDGRVLNVQATPEFFVNGRPMPSFGYRQLSQLVKEEVAKAY
jgi:protein-disulfide isomerase